MDAADLMRHVYMEQGRGMAAWRKANGILYREYSLWERAVCATWLMSTSGKALEEEEVISADAEKSQQVCLCLLRLLEA